MSVPVALLVVLAVLVALVPLARLHRPSPAAAAVAADAATLEITGRGWGHGRGLGQYGAYGYALDHGWSSTQILDHYYQGTTGGPVPGGAPVDPNAVRVDLRFMRNWLPTAAVTDGAILLRGLDGADLGRFATGAVRLIPVGGGFEVQVATSCAAPWSTVGAIPGRSTVRLVAESSNPGIDGLLQACGPSHRTWLRGELRAVVHNGVNHTVNVVTVEDYLRGVVPNEMPASWPSAALEAQAVAARSYALAGDTRQQPYADTCDTTLCQVYDGVATDRGGYRAATHARTDAAIAATTGTVRLTAGGAVARTEFSSSTGGYTAGGTFPAVVDDGDDIAANPNHTWAVIVTAEQIERRYGKGRLLAMRVTQRNGLGSDGGRAVTVAFDFERGTVTEPAGTVRSFLGLKSDWFTPGQVGGGALRETDEGRYIDRTYQRLVGRTASVTEVEQWHGRIAGGEKLALTRQLVVSDYFAGQAVDDLYRRALGREPDGGGRGYWVGVLGSGVKLQSIGIWFYGSPEYHARAGGNHRDFVAALYRDILGRQPDAGGHDYWTAQLNSGVAGLDDVAAGFYSSLESRRARAASMHQVVLGTAPGAEVRDLLAARLLHVDDLVLAAEIAASPEA
ncbi:MAG: SpoIID/LytB domain-containing protein [Acidimicrobiales bacterium]